jgi:ATP-dependent DNA helicase RecG
VARTIPQRESLTVEFKSDQKRLPDNELIAAVVCLANAEGGHIYLGVEDDGTITGLHASHATTTGLAALVANRTSPSVSVRAMTLLEEGAQIAVIEVPKSAQVTATSEGLVQRRRLQADGTPECVPFLPHEHDRRYADMGRLDVSASVVAEAGIDALDPLERVRIRQAIERYGGDRSLLGLGDDELDGALGLTRRDEGVMRPTLTGLLLVGYEWALRQYVPTYEVAFQVLQGTDVQVNDFYHTPLLKTFERVLEQVAVRTIEEEIQMGLFRVPVPNIDPQSFREAFVNALIHRDLTRLGAVHVRWEGDGIVISNPGGFVEGVTLANLLVVEPRPRNPLLADVAKRIGVAERTGRGVDLIYRGLLRYGRPAPDYGRSDSSSVVMKMFASTADRGLLRLVVRQEEQLGSPLPIDSLITLALLWRERRTDTPTVASAIQRDDAAARNVLERLVEAGLAEAHGVKKGRTYTLGPSVYREFGELGAYVRQVGFDRIQQDQMIRQYVKTHGRITRAELMRLCKLSGDQASRSLRSLAKQEVLVLSGSPPRWTFYVAGPNL